MNTRIHSIHRHITTLCAVVALLLALAHGSMYSNFELTASVAYPHSVSMSTAMNHHDTMTHCPSESTQQPHTHAYCQAVCAAQCASTAPMPLVQMELKPLREHFVAAKEPAWCTLSFAPDTPPPKNA